MEGDKQGDSEESSYDCKVGGSCPFMSSFVCHLTHAPPDGLADLSGRHVFGVRQFSRIYLPSAPVSPTNDSKGDESAAHITTR